MHLICSRSKRFRVAVVNCPPDVRHRPLCTRSTGSITVSHVCSVCPRFHGLQSFRQFWLLVNCRSPRTSTLPQGGERARKPRPTTPSSRTTELHSISSERPIPPNPIILVKTAKASKTLSIPHRTLLDTLKKEPCCSCRGPCLGLKFRSFPGEAP